MFRATVFSCRGSSPRVRGPPCSRKTRRATSRLIPASAGTTKPRRNPRNAKPAHPRECGDHPPHPWQPPIRRGSSPRVRGPLYLIRPGGGVSRLIPASAGTTCTARANGSRSRAHPRECGDHKRAGASAYRARGSSPRVRGPHLVNS